MSRVLSAAAYDAALGIIIRRGVPGTNSLCTCSAQTGLCGLTLPRFCCKSGRGNSQAEVHRSTQQTNHNAQCKQSTDLQFCHRAISRMLQTEHTDQSTSSHPSSTSSALDRIGMYALSRSSCSLSPNCAYKLQATAAMKHVKTAKLASSGAVGRNAMMYPEHKPARCPKNEAWGTMTDVNTSAPNGIRFAGIGTAPNRLYVAVAPANRQATFQRLCISRNQSTVLTDVIVSRPCIRGMCIDNSPAEAARYAIQAKATQLYPTVSVCASCSLRSALTARAYNSMMPCMATTDFSQYTSRKLTSQQGARHQ